MSPRRRRGAVAGGLGMAIYALTFLSWSLAKEAHRGELDRRGVLLHAVMVVGLALGGALLGWKWPDPERPREHPRRLVAAGLVVYPLLFGMTAAAHWPLPGWFCWLLAGQLLVVLALHLVVQGLRRRWASVADEGSGDVGAAR